MANQIKMFQGFVLESGFRAKQYKLNDYLKSTEKLHQDGNLSFDMVFMFYKHIISNYEKALKVITDAQIKENIDLMIENNLITEYGKFTDTAKAKLLDEGFYVDEKDVIQPLEEKGE